MEYDNVDLELAAAEPYLQQQARSQTLRPRPRPQALPSMPTHAVETTPPQPGTSPLKPTTIAPPDYRTLALEALQQAGNQGPSEEEKRSMIEYARKREEGANRDFTAGLALSALGGQSFAPVGQQVLRQALANREPLKFEGGFVAGGEFVADPGHAAKQRSARLESQARIYESMASHAETIAQRDAAARAADATRRELAGMQDETRRMIAANRPAPQEPLVQAYDPNTQTTTYVPRSQARGMQPPPRAGMGPGGRPLTPAAVDKISALEGKVDMFNTLVTGYKPDYAGLGTGVQNTITNISPWSTQGMQEQALWWKGYQDFVNEVRHDKFGAALTVPEKAEFLKSVITSETPSNMVDTFLKTQLRIAQNAKNRHLANLRKAGFDVNNFLEETGAPPGAPAPVPYDPGKPLNPRNVPPVGANVVDFRSLK